MGTVVSSPGKHAFLSRRSFLGLAAGTIGLAAFYPIEISRHALQVEKHDIFLERLPDSFRRMKIVQISDIHFEEFDEEFFVQHVVEVVNRLRPDMVLLTGDFVSYGPFSLSYGRRHAQPCAEVLQKIECPQRYAILGNHDCVVGGPLVTDALASHGIPVLENRAIPLERDGKRLWIVGLGSATCGQSRPEIGIPKHAIRDQEAILLMAHEPDILPEIAKYGVDFMLSGHTHGGQIRLPLVTPLFLPPFGRHYVEGRFTLGRTQLYVNRGIGAVTIPVRLNCPPEVTQFTLI
jgi:uncharacterized protein